MDHKMKQELMSRHRTRLRESIAPGAGWGDGDPVGRMLACWIIDIVADARELERGATMAELLSRSGLLESAPYGGPEVYTDERKVAAVEALERFDADTRQHAGFAMTTELTGSMVVKPDPEAGQ